MNIKKYVFYILFCLVISSVYSPNLSFAEEFHLNSSDAGDIEEVSTQISGDETVHSSVNQEDLDKTADLEILTPTDGQDDEALEESNSTREEATSTFAAALSTVEKPSVSYAAHVQDIGWQNKVNDGKLAGTEGKSKRLESIRISVGQDPELSVKYSTHVEDYGWLGYVLNGNNSGTTGKGKRLEAIKIELTGTKAKDYDIYYQVHVEKYGWMNWVKNGEMAGTSGESKRLEAIKIMILEKGATPDGQPEVPEKLEPVILYKTHVQDKGWLQPVSNGALSGTDGKGKQIEAVQIWVEDVPYSGGVTYSTHVQDYGWVGSVTNGKTSGTTGKNKQVEAIQIALTGEMANNYDIYYRVLSETFGWLDWAKNGESAGTEGLAKRLEAIEILLVEKGEAAPGPTIKPFITKPNVVYSSQVQDYGWMDSVANGALSGTEGKGKRLEAIKIKLQNSSLSGDITYSSFVQGLGWGNSMSNGSVSGTIGQSKRVEAIRIGLTGEIANYYDIYYRVHSQTFGWLGWAKNGESAGTDALSSRIEAIMIVLVEKNGAAPGDTDKHFVTKPSVVYSTQVQDNGWMDFVENGALSGTEGEGKRLEAIKINLQDSPYSGGITYSTHIQDYGWLNNVSNGKVSGTIGKSKRMEAILINLNGNIANYFDVYYRVHIESYGWLGWAKNGMKAGSEGISKRLEAIEIKLVPKGQGESVNVNNAFKQPKQPLKVFLDPGHGGSDPGATSGIYHEADLNLAVAKKVRTLLVNRGYQVIMSRNDDTYVGLLDRPQMANNLAADIFVSIHTNSTAGESTSASGIESYYYKYDPAYPSKINEAMHNNPDRISKSVTLASLINENMVNYTGAVDRGIHGETLAVVRESAMPATLLELGFINNSNDRQKLFTDNYQDILARAIADGIVEYFKKYN